ncbi:MAG: RNA pyrophosphohydrolase [Alphaproteobacteria bacterium]|nr:RNA pyrophosphohydrolase [Alphaproteobacteria bacterium]
MTMNEGDQRPYRPCVGVMLVNTNRKILIARRCGGDVGAWQMPQGGIEQGETLWQAGLRELKEEVGVRSVRWLAESKDWHAYDIPQELSRVLWQGQFRGLCQKWILMAFTGEDAEITLEGDHPEFEAWRWAAPSEIVPLTLFDNCGIYERVLEELWPQVLSFDLNPMKAAQRI